MTIDRIKCFVTLAEHLHFGRAADILYISQSTLSYNIAQLEEELQTSLFIRNNRKVILSSTGVKLLPIAKEILESAEQMERVAAKETESAAGITTLNLCLDRGFSRVSLLGFAEALRDLRAANPTLDIGIAFEEFDTLLHGTENMVYDISFGYLRNDEQVSDFINAIPLFDDEMVVVHNLPEAEGKTAEELIRDNPLYLIKNDSRWTDYFSNYVNSLGIHTKTILVDSFNDMYTHVRLGSGVTISNTTDVGVINGPADQQDFQLTEFKNHKNKCKVTLCAFWAKGNYNYAIMELLSRLNIDSSLENRLW